MAEQQYLLDLVSSINTNIHKKYINIIFLYAGHATNELTICKELVKQNFIINNIFLHDAEYRDAAFISPVEQRFNASGFNKLIFSRTCENSYEVVNQQILINPAAPAPAPAAAPASRASRASRAASVVGGADPSDPDVAASDDVSLPLDRAARAAAVAASDILSLPAARAARAAAVNARVDAGLAARAAGVEPRSDAWSAARRAAVALGADTVCIACNPQIAANNGINQVDGVNDGEDINNFISTFFSSEKNNFIFTTVYYTNFILYTKQNHIACVNDPANIHRPLTNKSCYFDTIYQIPAPVYYHGGKHKRKSCKRKSNKRKSNKRKRKSCKRKTNKYKRK